MSGWQDKLAAGAVTCRLMQAGGPAREFTPTAPDQLWLPIEIPALGERARGDFAQAYRAFVESGARRARYEGEACRTIEKFGQAMQFKEGFVIEFELRPRGIFRAWQRVTIFFRDLR